MSTDAPAADPRVIDCPDQPPDWDAYKKDKDLVRKAVIGQLGDMAAEKPLHIETLPEDFADRFPNLTHLYFWNCAGLAKLPALPAKLECLEVRGCSDVTGIPLLPETLDTLWLADDPALTDVPIPDNLPNLLELSFANCPSIADDVIQGFIKSAPALKRLDTSRCPQFTGPKAWPPTLCRIDVNDCTGLQELTARWPEGLYRLGLRGASRLESMPDFRGHNTIDYVDLANTTSLKALPIFDARLPRTLFLYGSGVELPSELKGETVVTNVAPEVFADQGEARWGTAPDDEVKVILLGNGRCGKTSLARRLLGKKFNPEEDSTHGIRLWTLSLPFKPIDSTVKAADSRGRSSEVARATVNIWDFAGQHLYQNTHRLFLQNRAIFLICGNDFGRGFDPESDAQRETEQDEGEDISHGFAYWKEQIEALGTGPRGEMPPVLVVTTKSDRKDPNGDRWAKAVDGVPAEDRIEFSARAGKATVAALKERLAERVATLLGRRGDRALGRRPLKLKSELAKLKRKNSAAWEKREKDRRAPLPKPTMPREVFFKRVRSHCPDGPYHQRPELLLKRLHRSGFLYWNENYLPDTVILDQRWAIDGIYSVLNREASSYLKLGQHHGLFSPSELNAWAWKRAGYREEERRLFLRFMQDCDVAIEMLDGHRTPDGQPRFLAPNFLPLEIPDGARRPENPNIDMPPIRSVENHAVVRLMRAVASRHDRDFKRWRWGLACDDFHSPAELRIGESLWVEWRPTSPESVLGDLTILIETRDPQRSYYAGMVEEALRHFANRGAVLRRPIAAPLEADGSFLAGRLPRFSAGPAGALPPILRVNISFSGNPGDNKADGPKWLHTALPSALRAALTTDERRNRGGFRVLDYQNDEGRRIASLRELMRELVRGDLMVVVISERYLESSYCMQELFEIARRLEEKPAGKLPDWDATKWIAESVKVFLLPDAHRGVRENQAWCDSLKKTWARQGIEHAGRMAQDHFDGSLTNTLRARRSAAAGRKVKRGRQPPDLGPCVGWFEATDEPQERQRVLAFLNDLTAGVEIPSEVLINEAVLAQFCEEHANQIVGQCHQLQASMEQSAKAGRLIEEVKRAQSESQELDAVSLFWQFLELDLNKELRVRFDRPNSAPPVSLDPALQSAWRAAKAHQREP